MFDPITSKRSRAEFREYAGACPTRQAALLRKWAQQSYQHDLLRDCCAIAATARAPGAGECGR